VLLCTLDPNGFASPTFGEFALFTPYTIKISSRFKKLRVEFRRIQ